MPLLTSEANAMLDFEGGRLLYLSIHTGDPSTSGANEASGGSYARQSLSWASATGGSKSAAQASFTPPAATYAYGGYWSASTGGTFLGSFAFAASKTIASGDTLKVTASLTESLS
jgi:hypothetical protein